MIAKPTGGGAVMAGREDRVAPGGGGKIDFFPTPPWGTRVLTRLILPTYFSNDDLRMMTAWDPCAGLHHMSDVLTETFREVATSDAYDYGVGDRIGDFVGLTKIEQPYFDYGLGGVGGPDFVIGNAPFLYAREFVERGLEVAGRGVCMLLRTSFIETEERFDLFSKNPFSEMWVFAGRLPMVENRWDPDASTATSYSWFVWIKRAVVQMKVRLVPPDAKQKYTWMNDVTEYAGRIVVESDARKALKADRSRKRLEKAAAAVGMKLVPDVG